MGKELNFYGLATLLSEKFNMTDNEIVETFEEALKKVLEVEQNSLKNNKTNNNNFKSNRKTI